MASTERCESKLSLVSNLSMIVSDTPSKHLVEITNLNPDTVTDQRKKAARDILAKYDHDSMMKISNAMTSLYDWAKAVAE
ncbi:hypothetical protein MAR_023478 [Mya arenaria]|uniref:Uncharacterized protein n=1 Tax=Mya arenaria TaxID=6604 RepID=A0ABY7DR02_MYAAR|nr:hypothetical protein MAR_023478 [Mya arenaria]